MGIRERALKIKQQVIGKVAENMVVTIEDAPKTAPKYNKPLSEAKVAFVTTAGVHLTSQKPFNTKGDHTCRLIPKGSGRNELQITHTHYDTQQAEQDLNCVFPLELLKEFEKESIVKEVGPHHFGLMGYIPNVRSLMTKTAPEIADTLEADRVDIALFSPG